MATARMVTERALFCGGASSRIEENDEPYKKPEVDCCLFTASMMSRGRAAKLMAIRAPAHW